MNLFQAYDVIKNVALTVSKKEHREREEYRRTTFNLMSVSGVGKTTGVIATGTKLFFPVMVFKFSENTKEDISIPYVNGSAEFKNIITDAFPRKLHTYRREIIDGEIVETDEFQYDFEAVKNYIVNYDEIVDYYVERGLSINDAPGSILFLDEINRIEDVDLFQMIFSLVENGRIKDYVIPESCSIFTATNPPTADYILSDWYADDAFNNRFIHLKVDARAEDFVSYAPDAGIGIRTIAFARDFPEAVFSKGANDFDLPPVKPSSRNFFRASFWIESGIIDWDKEIRQELISRILGQEFVGPYEEYLDNDLSEIVKVPSPEEILFKYDKLDVSEEILEHFRGNSRNDSKMTEEYLEELYRTSLKAENAGEIRERIVNLKFDEGNDLISRLKDDVVAYIKSHVTEDGGATKLDKEFEKKFRKNRLRFIQFLLDIPRAHTKEVITAMNNDKECGNALMQLLLFSNEELEGIEDDGEINIFVDLILYIDEKIKKASSLNEELNRVKREIEEADDNESKEALQEEKESLEKEIKEAI